MFEERSGGNGRDRGDRGDRGERGERGERGDRGDRGGDRGGMRRRRVCRFCADKMEPDYKDIQVLKYYLSERGKIVPRRISRTCAKHQRSLATSIKRARVLALLPYVITGA